MGDQVERHDAPELPALLAQPCRVAERTERGRPCAAAVQTFIHELLGPPFEMPLDFVSSASRRSRRTMNHKRRRNPLISPLVPLGINGLHDSTNRSDQPVEARFDVAELHTRARQSVVLGARRLLTEWPHSDFTSPCT